MQPLPIRLSQTLHIAFRHARPSPSSFVRARYFVRPADIVPHKPQRCERGHFPFPRRGPAYYSTTNTQDSPKIPRDDENPTASNSSLEEPPSKPQLPEASHPPPPLPPPHSPSSSSTTTASSLPLTHESSRSRLTHSLTLTLDHLNTLLLTSSRRLNDLTGYSAIESLKSSITALERLVASARVSLSLARSSYTSAVSTRSASQREVNALLQRKHAWSPADLERFTTLYRSDHANEVAEERAKEELARKERELEEVQTELGRKILERYHEEQIWSDKIRRMSTWGTWGLMAVNVLLFFVFQVAVEPWRRERLVRGVEERMRRVALAGEGKMRADVTPAVAKRGERETVEVGDHEKETPKEATAAMAATATLDPTTDPVEPALEDMTKLKDYTATTTTRTISTENERSQPQPESQPDLSSLSLSLSQRIQNTVSSYASSLSQSLETLFSDRPVTLTQRDITTRTLSGAAAGAAVVGTVLVMGWRLR